MLRQLSAAAIVLGVLVAAPLVRADVKTTERTQLKLEGMLGRLMGGAAKDGIVSTVAVKSDRKRSTNDTTGEIIDLAEEKVYRLDLKKKEYRVVTFDQLRQEWKEAQAEAAKNADRMRETEGEKPAEGKKLEFKADVKETGQRKAVAGHDAREVILTITATEQGKTLEDGGGLVMTSTMWLGPKIAALDEIAQFDLKFMKAVLGGDVIARTQQMATVFAMFASAQPMMEKMQAESRKLQGTALLTTTVMERVRSREEMQAAANQSQQRTSGGGLSGALAKRMMGGGGPPQQRSVVLTTNHEVLSVAESAASEDVAMPAGFKEKK